MRPDRLRLSNTVTPHFFLTPEVHWQGDSGPVPTRVIEMFASLIPSAPVFFSPTFPSLLRPMSTRAARSYSDAIDALNSLQTSATYTTGASGGRAYDFAIPEMLEYLRRIGHSVSPDLASGCTDR